MASDNSNNDGSNSGNTGADDLNKEQRILRMVKRVLTDVAKDTMTPQGMKHPLSEHTIQGIRDCLELVTSREMEIMASQGQAAVMKPVFADQPQKNVVVTLSAGKSAGKNKNSGGKE